MGVYIRNSGQDAASPFYIEYIYTYLCIYISVYLCIYIQAPGAAAQVFVTLVLMALVRTMVLGLVMMMAVVMYDMYVPLAPVHRRMWECASGCPGVL